MSDPIEYRVWWIPQLPLRGEEAFQVTVPDVATGKLLCDTLANYDLYQYENKIKPDYSNTGGVQYRHPALTQGDWEDLDVDDDDEVEYHLTQVAAL